MNVYHELKFFLLIMGLHIFAISLCALLIQLVFIAYVFFLTGKLDFNFIRIFVFVKAGAVGGGIAGFGVWLMYHFIPKFRA